MAYSGAYGARNAQPELFDAAGDTQPEATTSASPAPESRPKRGRRPILDLGELLQKTEIAGMETDDLLLALVLYLMYRESGDTDLLIMLGVLLLT